MHWSSGATLFGSLAIAAAALSAQAPAASAPSATITLSARISSLNALSGSSTVVAGLGDGQVVVWNGRDAAAGVTLKPHRTRVVAVGSDRDGRELWSLDETGSLARSMVAKAAAAVVKRLDTGTAPIAAAAFSSDGTLLAIGSARGEIRVYETATGTLTQRIQGHRTEVHAVALRAGSKILASASAEADLRVWDMATGRTVGSFDSDLAFFALAFSPRDGALASGGTGRRLTIHDPATFAPAGAVSLPKPRMVATLAWSADGRRLALGDLDDETLTKGGIQVVDAASRAVAADLDTGRVPASALVFIGNDVLVAAVDRQLRAWPIVVSR